MPTLIDRRGLRDDRRVAHDDEAAVARDAAVLLSLEAWRTARARWLAHEGPLGVRLEPTDDPTALADDLDRLSLVELNFPSFTDGRPYSSAWILRQRLGYRGELRAVGDVVRDALHLLGRCGFDTFALRDDQDVSESLAAFDDFSHAYQASVDRAALVESRAARADGIERLAA